MKTLLHHFDLKITTIVQQWQFLQGFMAFITHFGHPIVALAIGTGVILLGGIRANMRMVYAGVAVFITIGLGSALKLVLHRHRPLTEYVFNMTTPTFSFPSGHALSATVVYGLLAYLAWTYLPQPLGVLAVVIAVALIIIVGLSRIYLGAHYPSDVLGGWLLGCVALAIIVFVIKP